MAETEKENLVITVTHEDLQSRKVETRLKEQGAMARNRAYAQMREENLPVAPTKVKTSIWYNPVFTLAVFGLLGGLLASVLGTVIHYQSPEQEAREQLEKRKDARVLARDEFRVAFDQANQHNPYYVIETAPMGESERQGKLNELRKQDAMKTFLANLLSFGVAGLIIINGSVGATLGLLGGVVVALFADKLFRAVGGSGDTLSVRQVFARSVTWGVMGIFLTIGPGIVMKNLKRLGIGVVGGLVGGLIGGALWDYAAHVSEKPQIGKLVALIAIGVGSGVATGLIEGVAKKGWVRVIAGLIAGKQFILYRNPTFIGSSPDCQIYLFKDKKVGRRHAAIHIVKGGFEVEDLPLGASTLVNDKPVKRARLRNGDRVTIGATCFLFQEKT